jgi:HPt (histidine-containing phosphotransfer) domain-containing protein
MSDLSVLDLATLDDLIEHIGADAARAVIELFIGESRDHVALITAPGNSRDNVRRAAHSLKSSAGQIGASMLAAAAREVESAAETGAPTLLGAIAVLGNCAPRTESALAAKLQKLQ